MQPSLRGPASCCDFPPAHPRNPPSSLMNPHRRHRLELALVSALAFLAAIAPAQALAAASTKTVSFHGYRLAVPLSWPVYHLQANGTRCVRFDRHAVYLGQPSSRQQCPATPAGRTEAILVEQQRGSIRDLPVATAGGATATQFVDRTHHVVVTATWDRRPSLIRRALGVRSLPAATQRPASALGRANALMHSYATARAATVSAPGQIYTGSGFDACNTPSSSQMTAWGASPYRAIGV